MKKLLAIFITFILIGVGVNRIGVASPSFITPPYEFTFNTSTFQWNKLGFGDYDIMIRFMKEQVGYATVEIKDPTSGNSSWNQTHYKFLRESETFEQFISRISNTQLQYAIDIDHFPTNQILKVTYHVKSANTNGINNLTNFMSQFYTEEVDFTPQALGSNYVMPSAVLDGLNFKTVSGIGDTQQIPWTQIKRASLLVFNQAGSVVYIGDSKKNPLNDPNMCIVANYVLAIARRFITNDYTGVLTVTAGTNSSSQVYLLSNGTLVPNPQTIPPLLTLTKNSKGKFVVGIKGGAPLQTINLLCFTNLGSLPTQQVITLDAVGLGSWTNTSTSPVGFFSTRY